MNNYGRDSECCCLDYSTPRAPVQRHIKIVVVGIDVKIARQTRVYCIDIPSTATTITKYHHHRH